MRPIPIPSRTLAALLLLTTLIQPPTAAIDIIIQLDDDGQNPDFDTDGTRLQDVFFAAEAIWEQLLPDPGTYPIDVWWGNLDDGRLAEWQPTGTTADNNIVVDPTPRTAAGGNLFFYVDPTPLDHSEFDFLTTTPATPAGTGNAQGMTVYADLDEPTKNTWFDVAAPPDNLEIGFIGAASTPLLGERHGATSANAGTLIDLLSTVLHEIGHELGINGLDIEDGWEIEPFHINGITDVNMDDTDPDDGDHLQITPALMAATLPNAQRRLPTAADVLAVAWDESFTNVNLQRKHMLTDGDWNTNSNWVGNRKPDITTDAYLINGTMADLDGNARARNLTLSGFSTLFTDGNDLKVANDTRISTNAVLSIDDTAELENTFVTDSGQLTLQGGALTVGTFDNDNTAGAGITGHGTITIDTTFINNGVISPHGGTLTIQGPGTLDLDGDLSDAASNDGVIELIDADLHSTAPLTDDHDGVMTVGPGRTATLQFFALGVNGTLNLFGNLGAPATIDAVTPSDNHHFRGNIIVDDDAGIAAPLADFYPNADVILPDLEDTLELNSGQTRIRGGAEFKGLGTLVQNFDITLLGPNETAIDNFTFDWGSPGPDQLNRLTVETGGELIIQSQTTGDPDNRFVGIITLAGGTLDAQFTGGWHLSGQEDPNDPVLGTLIMFTSEGSGARLKGNHVTIAGNVEAQFGTSYVQADITLLPTSTFNVSHPAGVVRLLNITTLDGGAVFGPGTIEQLGDIHVTSDSTIAVDTFDWGNSLVGPLDDFDNEIRIDPGATLTIDTNATNSPGNPYRGSMTLNGGRLNVKTNLASLFLVWNLPHTEFTVPSTTLRQGILNLNQPEGAPAPAIEDGAGLIVNGTVNIDADHAHIHTALVLDDDSRTQFLRPGQLLFTKALGLLGGIIDHNEHHATLTTDNAASDLQWAGDPALTLQGGPTGSFTFDLTPTTNITIDPAAATTMIIDPGATLHVAGAVDPFTDTATPSLHVQVINNSTDTFHIDNALTVNLLTLDGVGNTVVGNAATLTADAATQNAILVNTDAALLIREPDSHITTTEALTNHGLVQAAAGDLTIHGPVQHNGTIHAGPGDTVRFTDLVAGPGAFTGPGTIVFDGGYEPGASPATTTFEGNLVFADTNTLFIEAAAPPPTPDPGAPPHHDRINVAGNLSLVGTLHVTPLPDNGPITDTPLGTEFIAITYGTRTPDTFFHTITGTLINTSFALAALLTDSDDPDTDDDQFILRASIPGDLNLDNKVTIADLSTFALNFNTTPGLYNELTNENSWELGDFNTDGQITVADLSLLALNFGFDATDPTSTPLGLSIHDLTAIFPGVAGLDPTTIPEPTTLTLLTLLFLPFRIRRTSLP